MRRVFDLREKIKQLMEEKGIPALELHSGEWMQDLAFMVNITDQMNILNK